jgi:predicted DNA-binding protein (MmcQ/YjbR family)
MSTRQNAAGLKRFEAICLSMPDARKTMPWGSPHFRIGEKIFAGCSLDPEEAAFSFKLDKRHAAEVVKRPGHRPAPYVGRAGWVQVDVEAVADWDEVREWVVESFCLIAPKRVSARLFDVASTPETVSRARSKRTAPAKVKAAAAKKTRSIPRNT